MSPNKIIPQEISLEPTPKFSAATSFNDGCEEVRVTAVKCQMKKSAMWFPLKLK